MEIPGYRLNERLTTATHHNLFLAMRDGYPGHFVVRICDVHLDAESQQQYIEQLERVRTLRHRGICEIVDVGWVDSMVYFVMPFYRGGSLSNVLATGLTMPRLLQIVRELCDSLNALHLRNLTHGDVKPSNVLFDHAGSVVLIDGSYLEPPAANVRFTPGYSAPELSRGDRPDVRSDVFSLGVLLLRVLSGELPWCAEKTGEPRSRDRTDAIPTLAPQHVVFASVIERMVALDPDDRYATTTHINKALAEIDEYGELSTVAVKSDLISTAEINAVLPSVRGTEGSMDDRAMGFNRRTVVNWLVASCVILAGVISVLAGVYELPATQSTLADLGIGENKALVEARLNAAALGADPKQKLQSIVAAYQAILEIEPDDPAANEAIKAARVRWVEDFETDLGQNDLNAAQSRLSDLLAIYPDDGELLALFDQLLVRRHALRLMSDTVALLGVTGFEAATSAEMGLHAFREVLRLYPASSEAAAELDKLAEHFLSVATHEVELGNIHEAMDYLNKAGMANPSFAGLPPVRERIQQATTLQAEIESRLAEADTLHRSRQLIDPPGRNAAILYHSVLTTDPDNEIALQGLGEVSRAVVEKFSTNLAAHDFVANRHTIERAKAVGLYPASIMHMESTMANEFQSISKAADLIIRAEQLIFEGFITEPAVVNAVAVLREAKQLDAANRRIDDMLKRCVDRLSSVARDAQEFGLTDVAAAYAALAANVTRD